jgi:hypothetical protein
MSKLKVNEEGGLEVEKKPIIITKAHIKEDVCKYGYEINSGPCEGDKIPNRTGVSIIHEDMKEAFERLKPHLAILDDAFKEKEMSFEEMSEESARNFSVSGFHVSGIDENEGYVIVGEKWVTQGTISLETPKISKGSAYPHWKDLFEAIENARTEVYLYMNGKSAPKYEQTEINFTNEDNGEFDNPM